MPRRNRDASPDAAAQAARQRFASRLRTDAQPIPLLQLPIEPGPTPDDSELESGTHYARTRWRIPWRVAALLAVVGVGIIAWHLWQSAVGQPTTEPLASSSSAGPGLPAASESPQSEAAGSVLVHVAGAVQKPGVVSLPVGSRVFQAIEAAGGVVSTAELNSLNLAEVVSDGAKIQVPMVGELPQPTPLAGSSGSAGGTGGDAAGAKVNINTASLEELGTLPRIGPVTAQGIIDWRKEHGPFASVDELDAVDGIGPKLMESLKDLVTVQGG
ncbi:helix-hairpin-helix domain-containing protein [Paenarthrobacter sp.]|uniref:helix-hairpin-helix domain-containing protein n=1 Tax=Paenarthrobacter sp. TaxID=1931993 RepID=UPI002810E53A|nr:helix-hairpin-helix domain-containing protein [Paenarthrobacter sp.]